MKFLSLFTDLKQLKEMDKFLSNELLISTETTEEDIDKIFSSCNEETFAYSIYNYFFMGMDDLNKYENFVDGYGLPKDITFDSVVKKNCIISAFYTLMFLKEKENFISLNEFVICKIKSQIPKEIREKVNYLFDSILQNEYLNRFALLKKVDKKRMIGNFNKDFTWYVILNRQNQSDTVIGETVKFSIESFLGSVEDTLHHSCNNKNEILTRKDKYKRHRSARNGIKSIFHGLSMIRDDWKCSDISDQIIFEYTKELAFHHNIILLFIKEMKKVLDGDNGKYENVLDFINDWHNVIKSPLIYDFDENMVNSLEMMYDVGYLFNRISFPILTNTFFITFMKKNKYDIEKSISDLERYIKNNYEVELTKNQTVFSSDIIFDEVVSELDAISLQRLAAVLIDIYSPTKPFQVYTGFKRPDHLESKSQKCLIADEYNYAFNKHFPPTFEKKFKRTPNKSC
ncbi:hypothetical protein [Lacrimispora sp.]|uniref:hypothetical protein n=1 Tax=Lacrimispora sp. TaxID=2719234 RepID=UPI0028A7C2AB|nr:hypothetical protein [Lacrimispora sp.]